MMKMIFVLFITTSNTTVDQIVSALHAFMGIFYVNFSFFQVLNNFSLIPFNFTQIVAQISENLVLIDF